MDELIAEFLSETRESLEKLDTNLLDLERNPEDDLNLNEVFRLFHTIKGTSGFLDLNRLGVLAHAAENLMSGYRSKTVAIQTEGISLILKTVDRIKDILNQINASGQEPAGDDAELIDALEKEAKNKAITHSPIIPDHVFSTIGDTYPVSTQSQASGLQSKDMAGHDVTAGKNDDDVLKGDLLEDFIQNLFNEDSTPSESSTNMVDNMAGELGRILLDSGEKATVSVSEMPVETPKKTTKKARKRTTKKTRDIRKPKEENDLQVTAQALEPQPASDMQGLHPEWFQSTTVSNNNPGTGTETTLDAKVRLDVLENLMNAVSELVLTRNQILQMQRATPGANLDIPVQRLNHITSELQEGIMKTRMQPVRMLWSRIPRMVRDVSLELGKSIECSMYGEDTEIDRQVLDYMRDPLLHLVRNACDHGIETPEERRKAGKPETGVINLRAYQEGGRILIEVSDDGRGIDTVKLRKKLIESGHLSASEAGVVTDSQLYNSMFEPGFSTSESISRISGRGVGLDVVRTNINKIGGSIDVRSSPGEGSAFIIKIPLSLAIVNALIVKCSEHVFALPQQTVLEVGRMSDDGAMQIKFVNQHPVLQTRGSFFPLVDLDRELKLNGKKSEEQTEKQISETWNGRYIIIVKGGSLSYGLVVDDIYDTEEIVVKPLSRMLSDIPYFSGNTIMGDGRVIMILDPHGLSLRIRSVSKLTQEFVSHIPDLREDAEKNISYLLFRDWEHKQIVAVNLLQVHRIEELDLSKVEYPSGRPAVVYNERLMPLAILSESDLPKDGIATTLIFAFRERNLALVIKEIVDIVESNAAVDISDPGKKIAGSAIINDMPVDLIDVDYFFQKYLPSAEVVDENTGDAEQLVMVIEANPIRYARYRQILQRSQARSVVHVRGQSALRAMARDQNYKHVLCSENLPDMSATDFVRELRQMPFGRKVDAFVICDEPSRQTEEKYAEAGYDGCLGVHNFQQQMGRLGLDPAIHD